MKVFLDMDGVLTDFMAAAHRYHGLKYSYPMNYPYPVNDWDIVKYTLMSDKEFWEPLGHEFWVNIPWTNEGHEILDLVEKKFGPENICLLTSPTLHSGCVTGKLEWVKNNLPQYKRRVIVTPAKRFLASEDSLLIDDCDKNLEEFVNFVPVPRMWNKAYRYSCDVVNFVKCFLEKYNVSSKVSD